MSTQLSTMTNVPLIRRVPRSLGDHQSGSWPSLAAMLRACRSWVSRTKQRDALMDLVENEHLLKDIGMTRDEALDEVNKPFWK